MAAPKGNQFGWPYHPMGAIPSSKALMLYGKPAKNISDGWDNPLKSTEPVKFKGSAK